MVGWPLKFFTAAQGLVAEVTITSSSLILLPFIGKLPANIYYTQKARLARALADLGDQTELALIPVHKRSYSYMFV